MLRFMKMLNNISRSQAVYRDISAGCVIDKTGAACYTLDITLFTKKKGNGHDI